MATATYVRSVVRWTAVWGAVCGIFVTQNVSRFVVRGTPVDWFQALALEALYWVPFLALTPALLAAVHRFPIGGARTQRNVVCHLLIMAAVGALQVASSSALQVAAMAVVEPAADFARAKHSLWLATPSLLITAFWKYWVFIGVCTAFDAHRRLRDRDVKAAQLETQLATAKLQSLKAQLHPHFLFNTLHSVSMLNVVDVEAANEVLVRLSDLLRRTLDRAGALEVKLSEEIDFLDRYLAIEHVRFADRLTVRIDVDDTVCNLLVPNLILQPLVENALRHGIAPRSQAGCLTIRARHGPGRRTIILEVEDDGPGLPATWSMANDAGVGLTNVRDRLSAAYGNGARLELASSPRGLLARIVLPRVSASVGAPA